MSQIKLLHSGGNGVILAAPDSNPASDRTLKLPSDGDGTILTTNSSVGKILQVVSSVKSNTASASVSRSSDWVGHGLSVSITPSSASNKILISGHLMVSEVAGESAGISVVLYKAGSILTASIGDAGSGQRRVTAGTSSALDHAITPLVFQYLDTAGGTSSITYQPALNTHHGSGQQMYLNRTYGDTADESYVRSISVMTAMEIAA